MKSYFKHLFLLIAGFLLAQSIGAKVLYDQKYVTPGVLSNVNIRELSSNPSIRFLGQVPDVQLMTEGGHITLDKLLNLHSPDILPLYKQALKEATGEEREIAEKDITATPELILQQEGAVQLLKNNYVIFINPIKDKEGKETTKSTWRVFHVDIDDEIINQVFYNWTSPAMLAKINPKLRFLGSGKIEAKNMPLLIYDIQKKVGAFAIRGPIISNHPTAVAIGENQPIRKGYKMQVFNTREDKNGNTFSKKIADARVAKVKKDNSVINIISGKYPNYKNGDIGIVSGRGGWTLNVEGQYSPGPDWKFSGRIFSEKLLRYYSTGISNYFIFGGEVGVFNRAPEMVWYEEPSFESACLRPRLGNIGLFLGYGLGYSFLTKFEIIPYLTVGCDMYSVMGIKRGYIWNEDEQQFLLLSGGPNPDINKGFMALNVDGGLRLAINIFYPLQLTVGCSYKYNMPFANEEDYWVTKRHELNRVNTTVGFRYNF